MLEILGLILPLFGLIVIGFAAGRIAPQPAIAPQRDDAMRWLNIFIIYVALPALFFKLLSKTPIDQLTNAAFILTNLSVTFGVLLIAFLLGLIGSGGKIADAGVQGLAAAYGNIGYMGPAIAILAFGETAAVPVALIFCFENVLHFAFAPMIMAISGRGAGGILTLIIDVVRKILLHPFIIATVVGVSAAALQVSPPEPVSRLIDYLAQAAAPCALFAMGVTLATRRLRRLPSALGFIVPLKLIAHPLAMYLALAAAGVTDPVWLFTAVLLAALPTATNVFVIAQQYGVWVERASASILVTTALSVLTVSYLLFLIKTGALPPDPALPAWLAIAG